MNNVNIGGARHCVWALMYFIMLSSIVYIYGFMDRGLNNVDQYARHALWWQCDPLCVCALPGDCIEHHLFGALFQFTFVQCHHIFNTHFLVWLLCLYNMCVSSLTLFLSSVLHFSSLYSCNAFVQCLGWPPFYPFYPFFLFYPLEFVVSYSIRFYIPCIVHHWPIVPFHQILSVRPFVTLAIIHFTQFYIFLFCPLFSCIQFWTELHFSIYLFRRNSAKTFLVSNISLLFNTFSITLCLSDIFWNKY